MLRGHSNNYPHRFPLPYYESSGTIFRVRAQHSSRSYGTLTSSSTAGALFILFVHRPAATTSIMIKMYSQRGKELTVVDGYKYRKYCKNKEEQNWRCIVKMCNAKIVTNIDGDILLNTEVYHNHDKDETVHRQMITNAAKSKASEEDLFDRPSKLIRREICSAPQEIREKITTKDINLARRNLYRQRRKLHPRLPETTQEIHEALQVVNTESNNGEELLLVNNSKQDRIAAYKLTPLTHKSSTKLLVETVYQMPRRGWEDNIKMDLREMGYNDRD
ncbi:hypothetical protein ANN_03974 [Periplaneta americana]|uniref:FLYWCH-type domain-containing protein n=1 Tax=Periplaneta americana TaxID=6978 RepID=A0ABQ8T810_PERAM|nr:hypothetical protein ANN_03974 [Periplaneta americana]